MADKIALFCNVEPRAVIEERDKEFSIYEVPLSLVDNRLDELIVEKLEPARPSRWTSTTGAQMVQRIMQPDARGDDRRRRQVHQAPRRLQVGLRVARPRRHRHSTRVRGAQGRGRGGRTRGRRAGARRRRRHPGARRLRHRGIEGKIEAIRFARERQDPVLRHLPGHAVRRHRVRPQRPRPGGRQHAPSSTATAATRWSACWTSSTHITRHGRHDAAGRLSVRAAPRAAWPIEAYGSAADPRAAPASLRVQQRLPQAVRRRTA